MPDQRKNSTIPKLELKAAAIAASMKTNTVEELELGINQVFMRSYSKTVINFTNNEHTRYNVYTLHRTNIIRNVTKFSDWRHIPRELNVADFPTMYTEFSKLTSTCSLYKGPIFYMKEII